MSKYPMLPSATAGTPVKADYGNALARGIRALLPKMRDGQRISTTPYGTKIDYDADADTTMEMSDAEPFEVEWHSYAKDDPNAGEWQIYLPYGCAYAVQNGNAQACVPVNNEGKDKDGKVVWQWFKIPDPSDEDAQMANWDSFVAKEWTVYVHVKPWPRMKASTRSKDPSFGRVSLSVPVATIGIVGADGDTWHLSKRLTKETQLKVERNTSSAFSVRYEITGKGTTAKPTVKVVEKKIDIGRAQLSDKDTDITGWKQVWCKITHDSEKARFEVKENLSNELSDDDKTVFQLYEMEDNVIVSDLRANIPTLDFYTNQPK